MTNKSAHEFTKLDEAYKVLDKFYFSEFGGDEGLLDQLDSAFCQACGSESNNYRQFNELIEQVREMVGDAMDIAIKVAAIKLKEVGRTVITNPY